MLKELKKIYAQFLSFDENEYGEEVCNFLQGNKNFFLEGTNKSFFETLIEKSSSELDTNTEIINKIKSVKTKEDIKPLLFPENSIQINNKTIQEIRNARSIEITEFAKQIENPLDEILFTSNVMLTLPKNKHCILAKYAEQIDFSEPQEYWFDHPIPLDIKDESNEILYGLEHFNESVKTEKHMNEKAKLVLSVSCTHSSLKKVAKEYLVEKIKELDLDALEIYIFTENECQELLDICFSELIDKESLYNLGQAFGVDGKYGRHYTFLKAVSVFFSKVVDSRIKATYKIDLDQVFDQKKIKEYTGSYAFGKFVNEKFGAYGVDTKGRTVKLGMVAGYLINDEDIEKSMYEPDVKISNEEFTTEQYIFNSSRPQYVSTVAEMLGEDKAAKKASLRYHITGGMNGILIEDLYTYKPFTPSFITRAEDQCFMLSVINKPINDVYLRCYHQHGLFMRHDKGSFLSEDLKIFEVPKKVGDFERILLFSHYAKDILENMDMIKEEIQPFTSAFISDKPYTLLLFRILFASYEIAKDSKEDAELFIELCASRLSTIIERINSDYYIDIFNNEVKAWEIYYSQIQNIKIGQNKINRFLEEIRYVVS